MILYHYTCLEHLVEILDDRELKLTDSNLEPMGVDNRVVWLLDTPTADEFDHGLSGPGLAVDKKRIRITVDVPEAIRWIDWAPTKDMLPWWRDALVKTGGGIEAACHWYVQPAAIPIDRWIEIADMKTGETIRLRDWLDARSEEVTVL